jgi:hypothetical protein
MSPDDQFDELIEHLSACISRARALKLHHAVHLLQMTTMEVADHSTAHPSKPAARRKSPALSHF